MNRHIGTTICRTINPQNNPTFPSNRITQDSPVATGQQPNQPEKTEPKT
jgi:hypothetical protein